MTTHEPLLGVPSAEECDALLRTLPTMEHGMRPVGQAKYVRAVRTLHDHLNERNAKIAALTHDWVAAIDLAAQRNMTIHMCEAEITSLKVEVERLSAWLRHIEGGDSYCRDARQLRQWAYEATTLGRPAP